MLQAREDRVARAEARPRTWGRRPTICFAKMTSRSEFALALWTNRRPEDCQAQLVTRRRGRSLVPGRRIFTRAGRVGESVAGMGQYLSAGPRTCEAGEAAALEAHLAAKVPGKRRRAPGRPRRSWPSRTATDGGEVTATAHQRAPSRFARHGLPGGSASTPGQRPGGARPDRSHGCPDLPSRCRHGPRCHPWSPDARA